MKPQKVKTAVKVAPVIHNHANLDIPQIEARELLGVHRNNWQANTVHLYASDKPGYVYAIGRRDNGVIVCTEDNLDECMNFRIALDYWKHGQKVYTRD